MRKLISLTHVSLDGVMQSPGASQEDPTNGFELGGWIVPYWDQGLAERLDRTVSKSFDLLLGRRTYDMFATHWPYADDGPITDGFNRAAKYVATRGTLQFDWTNTKVLQGDVLDAVRALKAADGPEIQIYGSSNFLQTLFAADLIDEYLIWTYPVVLGRGRRLFEEGAPVRAMRLVESEQSATGVVTSRYVPDGPAKPDSFGLQPSAAELERRRRMADEP